jgi:hypothetical protein
VVIAVPGDVPGLTAVVYHRFEPGCWTWRWIEVANLGGRGDLLSGKRSLVTFAKPREQTSRLGRKVDRAEFGSPAKVSRYFATMVNDPRSCCLFIHRSSCQSPPGRFGPPVLPILDRKRRDRDRIELGKRDAGAMAAEVAGRTEWMTNARPAQEPPPALSALGVSGQHAAASKDAFHPASPLLGLGSNGR